MVTNKCSWKKRNVSDFERRNYIIEKYRKGTSSSEINISKSPYGDIEVITPKSRMNAQNITIARKKARAYMKKYC